MKLKHYIWEIAHAVEDALPQSRWLDSPATLIGAIGSIIKKAGSPIDPDLADHIWLLEKGSDVRSHRELMRISHAVGLEVPTGDLEYRKCDLRRLAMASRDYCCQLLQLGDCYRREETRWQALSLRHRKRMRHGIKHSGKSSGSHALPV